MPTGRVRTLIRPQDVLDDTLPEQLTDLVINGISQPSITDTAIPLS